MKISSNYYISDKKGPSKHKMISSLDEILQLREHDEYHLLFKNNNLGELVCNSRRQDTNHKSNGKQDA